MDEVKYLSHAGLQTVWSKISSLFVRYASAKGDIVPDATNTRSLGSSTVVWKNAYATTFIGGLTGNAATATALQTARTIWGQSFDGRSNITGAMTGVTTIAASGDITTGGGVSASGIADLTINRSDSSVQKYIQEYAAGDLTDGSYTLTHGLATSYPFLVIHIATSSSTVWQPFTLNSSSTHIRFTVTDSNTVTLDVSGVSNYKVRIMILG